MPCYLLSLSLSLHLCLLSHLKPSSRSANRSPPPVGEKLLLSSVSLQLLVSSSSFLLSFFLSLSFSLSLLLSLSFFLTSLLQIYHLTPLPLFLPSVPTSFPCSSFSHFPISSLILFGIRLLLPIIISNKGSSLSLISDLRDGE